jgi:hypothetical protein
MMDREIENFDQWMYNIGIAIPKRPCEDWEEYVNKVSYAAWKYAEQ